MPDLILSLDQGTTGSNAAFFLAESLEMLGQSKVEFQQVFPRPGWVEHRPDDIWDSQNLAIKEAWTKTEAILKSCKLSDIIAIGITNQRETIVPWNRKTGAILGNALVWQDRRTADFCNQIQANQHLSDRIRQLTGLIIDPYFSATKMRYLIRENEQCKVLKNKAELALGTIDSFLIYRLSGAKDFLTDHSNASRTMLYSLQDRGYSAELLEAFGIPESCLPQIQPSVGRLAKTNHHHFLPDGIPICGCLGDQQAALFGQDCEKAGEGKITYGTGAFILLNCGNVPIVPKAGLLGTVAYADSEKISYALEGSAFIAGAAIQYLRDNFGFFKESSECELLALSEERDEFLSFVPAFSGLGAPYWNPRAKAALFGLSRGSSKAQVTRAVLESIALQNVQIFSLMQPSLKCLISRIGIDGGAAFNNYLMQFQADILRVPLTRPQNPQSTLRGAAKAAARGLGLKITSQNHPERLFIPKLDEAEALKICAQWEKAAEAVNSFYS